MKTRVMVALATVMIAGPVFAQATLPQNPPAKPAQQPPAPAAAKPPAPFPEGAKVAYVFMNAIFGQSASGKVASAQFQDWEKKKNAEIQGKAKQGQDLQAKLQQGGGVMSQQARAQAERQMKDIQRDLQAMQEDAQLEGQKLQQKILEEFSLKANPVIEQVATERGLHIVFSIGADSSIAWANPGLDLTAEIVKRLDAAAPAKK